MIDLNMDEKIRASIKVQVLDLTEKNWNQVSQRILEIDRLSSINYLKRINELPKWFTDKNNVVVTLSVEGVIIGWTIARPVSSIWPERNSEDDLKTVNISMTEIVPDYQGSGLVWEMMPPFEAALKSKGYKFMERNSSAPKYADSIHNYYQERIIEEGHNRTTQFGLQRFFKIKI